MFCATRGTIKAAGPEDLELAGAQVMLANTYHLMLRPGSKRIQRLGGLHRVLRLARSDLHRQRRIPGVQPRARVGGRRDQSAGSRRPDSGSRCSRITEHGAVFKSYVDGQRIVLTPERAIQIQRELGSDLAVVLDECTPVPRRPRRTPERSMEMTHRWADRCARRVRRGTTTGGRRSTASRREASTRTCGGVRPSIFRRGPSSGTPSADRSAPTKRRCMTSSSYAQAHLRRDRPVHLLGIGGVDDIFQGSRAAASTRFDCVRRRGSRATAGR